MAACIAEHTNTSCMCQKSHVWCRVVEDYGVIYLGSAVFKIARLLFVALFSVHMFACIFFRVKVTSALSPEDVEAFYISKNAADHVRRNSETHAISSIVTCCETYFHWVCATGPRATIREILILSLNNSPYSKPESDYYVINCTLYS
jgi:hypothetical protein